MKYETRVLLYLDILGFQNHLDKTVNKDETDNEIEISNLHEALMTINNIVASENKKRMVTQFSDTLVISFLASKSNQVLYLFEDIADLIISLINNNIICRGAISYGKLIHTKDIIFGPALVDAYLTESKAAMYPRVICDQSIIDIGIETDKYNLDRESAELGLLSYLGKDEDDKYYIDYFEQSHYKMNLDEIIDYAEKLRQIIVLGKRSKKPDLKVKYGWMKTKYNKMIKKFTSQKFVDYFESYSDFDIMRLKKLRPIN